MPSIAGVAARTSAEAAGYGAMAVVLPNWPGRSGSVVVAVTVELAGLASATMAKIRDIRRSMVGSAGRRPRDKLL